GGRFDASKVHVPNPQATGNGTDPSSTPQMTVSDFDAARAQLEQSIHQTIAQELSSGGQPGERLAETIIFGPPQFTTDHQPQEKVPSFTGTMTVSGEGDFYNDADVIQAYKTHLTRLVPSDQQLLTERRITLHYVVESNAPSAAAAAQASPSPSASPKRSP